MIRKAEREKARGVLVTPDWPGSSFLAVVEEREKAGSLVLLEKFQPVLICPEEIRSDTFRGVPKFKFCVYGFNF